jgi:hypothetical protein
MSILHPTTAHHRIHTVHRVSIAALGVFLLIFGVLGLTERLEFLSSHGAIIMGLSTNGLLAAISVLVAVVLTVAAARGGPTTGGPRPKRSPTPSSTENWPKPNEPSLSTTPAPSRPREYAGPRHLAASSTAGEPGAPPPPRALNSTTLAREVHCRSRTQPEAFGKRSFRTATEMSNVRSGGGGSASTVAGQRAALRRAGHNTRRPGTSQARL